MHKNKDPHDLWTSPFIARCCVTDSSRYMNFSASFSIFSGIYSFSDQWTEIIHHQCPKQENKMLSSSQE